MSSKKKLSTSIISMILCIAFYGDTWAVETIGFESIHPDMVTGAEWYVQYWILGFALFLLAGIILYFRMDDEMEVTEK